MLTVSSKGRRTAAGLQGVQHGVDFSRAKYRLLERLDIADKSDALGHVGWHFGFEGAAANEGDDRMQVLGVDTKAGFQGFEVFVVLPQRVLEFKGAFAKSLRPLRLPLGAEDPAAHVLRFQYEDAVDRQKDVIDLRRAVGRIQSDVVQASIGALIQLPVREEAHQKLADIAFGPWRFEQADQQGRRDEPGQHAPDLADNRAVIHFLP